MKRMIYGITGLAAVGLIGISALAQATDKTTTSVSHVEVPAMTLHKAIETEHIRVANLAKKFVVGVEVDYDRSQIEVPNTPALPIPGMGGPDMSDPFFRYDIGPFSGILVGPRQIIISDRTLGSFSEEGAGEEVEAITVTFPDGQRWPAKVKGRHQQVDLALLEIDVDATKACNQLEVVPLVADRVKLKRGQKMMVVGRGQNPLRPLVNDGVISALERADGRAFQFDARVGNSTLGAPAVDMTGRLIGVVTLHNHQTFGQASGVSYAAYTHEVQQAYDVMKEGKFIKIPPAPFMGVGANKKWPDKPGLEIGNVVPGSGAEKAGIQNGDIIIQVDGKDMNSLNDLLKVIKGKKVGDTLKVKRQRGEKIDEVEVTLGERP